MGGGGGRAFGGGGGAGLCGGLRGGGIGEVDAGVVYTTDVRAAGDELASVPVPAESGVAVAYPIVTLSQGASPETAAAFVDFVRSDAGLRILTGFGFEAP